MEDAELMAEYDSELIDDDFDDAEWDDDELAEGEEWGETEDGEEIEWDEQDPEETVSISMQSSLVVNSDDDAEDWADELDSEYNE
jgi:hypothetical protein